MPTLKELQEACKAKGLKFTGSKKVLIETLNANSVPIPDSTIGIVVSSLASVNLVPKPKAGKATLNNNKPVITRSSNKDKWEEVSRDRTSSILTFEDLLKKPQFDYIPSVNEVYQRTLKVVEAVRRSNPGVPTDVAVFVVVSQSLFRNILQHTSLNNTQLDGFQMSQFVGILMRENLINLSHETKYPMALCEGIDFDETLFSRIIHNINCAKPDSLLERSDNGEFTDPMLIPAKFDVVIGEVSDDFQKVSESSYGCLDDDLIPSNSKQMTVDRAVVGRTDKRKGMGFSLNTTTNVHTNIVTALFLQGARKNSPAEIHSKTKQGAGSCLFYDRGYCEMSLVEYLKSRQIQSMGILNETSRASHPVTLYDYKSFSDMNDETGSELPPLVLQTYVGAGMQVRAFKRNDNVCALSVINRTSKTSPGHLRFLGAAHACGLEDLDKFVQILGHMPLEERKRCLSYCVKNNDERAKFIYTRIGPIVKLLTLGQGTSDWYLLRRTGFTASVSGPALKLLLKHLLKIDKAKTMQEFGLVIKCLWKHNEEQDLDILELEKNDKKSIIKSSVSLGELISAGIEINEENPHTSDVLYDSFPSQFPDNLFDQTEESDEQDEQQADEEILVIPSPLDDVPVLDNNNNNNTINASNINNNNNKIPPINVSNKSKTKKSSTNTIVATTTTTTVSPPLPPPVNQDEMEEGFRKMFAKRFIEQSFITKFNGNDSTTTGKLMEPRIMKVLERNDFVVGKKVFTLGLTASNEVPYVYDSKDGIFVLDLHKVSGVGLLASKYDDIRVILSQATAHVVCGLESKTSKDFEVLSQNVKIAVVVAGSQEYHNLKNLKLIFKPQMLHQSFVGRLNWNLLSAWHPTNPSSLDLIYYPSSTLDQFKNLVEHPQISFMFKWFHTAALSTATDSEINKLIPKEVDFSHKQVLASHTPLLRAVLKSAIDSPGLEPIGPTHTYRTMIIALYDLMKGATDVECRRIADMWKCLTQKLRAVQKLTIRLIYSCVSVAIGASSIYNYVNEIGGVKNLPKSIFDFRRMVRLNTPFTDLAWKLAGNLQTSGICLGSVNFQVRAITPFTPLSSASTEVWAALPNEMKTILLSRPTRSVQDSDFFGSTKFVVQPGLISRSTPGGFCVKDNHVADFSIQLKEAFDKLPSKGEEEEEDDDDKEKKRTRSKSENVITRVNFWNSPNGKFFRTSTFILIHPFQSYEGRKKCLVCNSKPRDNCECILCGEVLCATCFDVFHSDSDLNPLSSEAASIKKKLRF